MAEIRKDLTESRWAKQKGKRGETPRDSERENKEMKTSVRLKWKRRVEVQTKTMRRIMSVLRTQKI